MLPEAGTLDQATGFTPATEGRHAAATRHVGPAAGAGGSILAAALIVTNAGNYLLNLLLGRWLTPAEFSDANLMVTLMLTFTSVSICLELVAARFVGIRDAAGRPTMPSDWRRRCGTGPCGVGLAIGVRARRRVAAVEQPVQHRVSRGRS